jgi:hypothetical protein
VQSDGDRDGGDVRQRGQRRVFGTSRSVWAARIGITPSGMCRLRWRTTVLSRIGASTANGAARSPQVRTAATPTTAAT